MGKFKLISFASADELARAAANAWLEQVETASRVGRRFLVALSGGRIARPFFAATVQEAKTRGASLERVDFFWADERCVPPDEPESNFRLARELLLMPLQIPENHIHRIRAEQQAALAAAEAEAELRLVAPPKAEGLPVLDLVFLGMGEDGHVASLFPGEDREAADASAIYRAVTVPKPPPRRITMAFSAIAAARQVWVLASGDGKEATLRESLAPSGRTPLAQVIRQRRETLIYSDIQLR
jgi:6-phosphogluconolactonase